MPINLNFSTILGRARKTGTTTFTFPPPLPADIELFPLHGHHRQYQHIFLRNNTMAQSLTRWVGKDVKPSGEPLHEISNYLQTFENQACTPLRD